MTTIEVCEVRYEDDRSYKFYRAYLWGGSGLTQWGRIGTIGQFRMLTRTLARRKISEKLAKGYEMVLDWITLEVGENLLQPSAYDFLSAAVTIDGSSRSSELLELQPEPEPEPGPLVGSPEWIEAQAEAVFKLRREAVEMWEGGF